MKEKTNPEALKKLNYIRSDLYLFYRYYIGSKFKENVNATHIDKLATALMQVYRGDYKRLCVAMPPRHKIADSTPVLTSDGWSTHGELKKGDKVYTNDGTLTKVTDVSTKSECDQLITFNDNSTILAHKGHLWGVIEDNKEYKVLTTSEIAKNLPLHVYQLPDLQAFKHGNKTYNYSKRTLTINNITTTPDTEQGHCITIDNPNGIYLAGENLIPTHNSKSSMITEAFPLWLIFHNPNLNILIVNMSSSLSEKFGIVLRELVKEYGHEFNVYLSDVKSSSTYLMFADEDKELYNGSIRLVGAGGSITGQDVDYLIIDDLYDGFIDITPGQLEKKINWFNTIIEQRLEPHSRLIILHTRWHSQDLQGYLKETASDEYKFITFPAISKDNKPLWPERYTVEMLEKKRESMGPRLFNSIYQQEPIDDDGDFFDTNNIKWRAPTDYETAFSCRAWDTASADGKGGGVDGDYTVGIRMILTQNKEFVVTDMIRGQFGQQTKDTIFNAAHLDGVDTTVVIETGVAAAGKFLYGEWVAQLPGYFVEQALPLNSKVDRATPFKNAIADGKVWINIEDNDLREALIKEFKSFPDGKHDDIVDACAHAYNYLAEFAPAIGMEFSRVSVW